MSNLKQKRILTVFPWYYVIVTIVLYSGVLYSFGINRIALGILTIIWYPYLCYYLTNVEFYDNYMIIRHPLLFFCSKTILYENISYMRLTEGKGTMMKVFTTEKGKVWTFSPPLLKKKGRKMIELIELKGITCENII